MPSTNLRLPSEIHTAAKAAAADDRRSINSELIILLEEALTARGYLGHIALKDGAPIPETTAPGAGRDPTGVIQTARAAFQDLADVEPAARREAIAEIRTALAAYL